LGGGSSLWGFFFWETEKGKEWGKVVPPGTKRIRVKEHLNFLAPCPKKASCQWGIEREPVEKPKGQGLALLRRASWGSQNRRKLSFRLEGNSRQGGRGFSSKKKEF